MVTKSKSKKLYYKFNDYILLKDSYDILINLEAPKIKDCDPMEPLTTACDNNKNIFTLVKTRFINWFKSIIKGKKQNEIEFNGQKYLEFDTNNFFK